MPQIDYTGENTLTYALTLLKNWAVAKEAGKGLSSNDFTNADKAKLDGLKNITVTSTTVSDGTTTTNPIPVAAASITSSDTGYTSAIQVYNYVADALSHITGISFEIVQVLPATGDAGKIYLVPHGGSSQQNIYDEYIYFNNAWEKIGTTEVDLSNYVQYSDLSEISNQRVQQIWDAIV